MLPPIWDPHTKQKIFQLEKVQRRAVRWTTSNYDYRSSVTAMLQSLGWRTLELRRANAHLCLVYKIVYGLVAVPLPVYIQQSNRLSWHCHSMTFTQIHTSKDFYKYSFIHWLLSNGMLCPNMLYLPIDSFKEAVGGLQHSSTGGHQRNYREIAST